MTDLTLKRYILKTLKINNYKHDYRLMNKLPPYLMDTLIGLLLSDGGITKIYRYIKCKIKCNYVYKYLSLYIYLYNLFEPYIDTDLKVIDIKSSNKLNNNRNYSTIRFKTISTPQFIYYYNIFYKKNIILNK